MEEKPKIVSTETHSFVSLALKILSVPVAAAAGLWVLANDIRNSVYDRIKFHDGFKSIKPNEEVKAKMAAEKAAVSGATESSKAAHEAEISFAVLPDSQKESSEAIAKAVKDVFEGKEVEKGFVDKIAKLDKLTEKSIAEQLSKYDGLNKLSRQWKFSHKTARQRALINGLTVSGIVLAAILPLANSKTLMGMLSKEDKEKPDQRSQ